MVINLLELRVLITNYEDFKISNLSHDPNQIAQNSSSCNLRDYQKETWQIIKEKASTFDICSYILFAFGRE